MASQITLPRSLILCAAMIALVAPAATAADSSVLLSDGGELVWVQRPGSAPDAAVKTSAMPDEICADRVTQIVIAQMEGPTAEEAAAGLTGFFPPGGQVDAVTVSDGQATVSLTLPDQFLEGAAKTLFVWRWKKITSIANPKKTVSGIKSLNQHGTSVLISCLSNMHCAGHIDRF